MILIALRL